MIEYPMDVIRELASLRTQAEKGVGILAEAEKNYVMLSMEADKQESLAFLEAGGAVAERQHIARLKSFEAKQAAELARVEVNRVKLKLKQISEAQMNVQSQSRMIELEYKTTR